MNLITIDNPNIPELLIYQQLRDNAFTEDNSFIADSAKVVNLVNVSDKWVLLMRHEGHGISKEILKLCSEVVHIEMEPNIKSFNVAVAASILMYEFKFK